MHQGVIRDIEQQRIKRERQLDFDMQRALEAEYKKDQTVRDGAGGYGSSSGSGPGMGIGIGAGSKETTTTPPPTMSGAGAGAGAGR